MTYQEKYDKLKELGLLSQYKDDIMVAPDCVSNFGIDVDNLTLSEDKTYWYFKTTPKQIFGCCSDGGSRYEMPRNFKGRECEKKDVLRNRFKWYKWILLFDMFFISIGVMRNCIANSIEIVLLISAAMFMVLFNYSIPYFKYISTYSVFSSDYFYRWRLEDEFKYNWWYTHRNVDVKTKLSPSVFNANYYDTYLSDLFK